ncbi:MAG: hypothetical protein ACOY93_02000 [Bacillota bacterium]
MAAGVERFLLYNPTTKLYHCGGFLDGDFRRAYLFQSLQFARQGLMQSIVDLGNRKEWKIQRVLVHWDEFGDITHLDVLDEI